MSEQVYGLIIFVRSVASQESKEGRFRAGVDDGKQVVEEDGVGMVEISPRRFGQVPHRVVDEAGGRDAQTVNLVEYVESFVPLLRPATRRKPQDAWSGPLKVRMVGNDEMKVAVEANFFGFHSPNLSQGI